MPSDSPTTPGATATKPSSGPPAAGQPRLGGGSLENRRSELVTEHGKTSIADSVVEKIAGVSAAEVDGVHAMGKSRARAMGALRGKIPVVSGPSPSQGVSVEVGERQAAVDLDLVVVYGVSIVDVAQAVRDNVIGNIEQMTGLEVTEVNVAVDDVWMGDDEEEQSHRRVTPEAEHQDAVDLDAVADTVAACPSVVCLSTGPFGQAVTHLPGRRVNGLRIADGALEVHVVANWVPYLPAVADEVRAALRSLVGPRPIHVYIEDLSTGEPTDQTDEGDGTQAALPDGTKADRTLTTFSAE